jgi:hypothetical protein
VGCRSVPGRETFSGNDEDGCVRIEVEEKLSENVDGEKTVTRKFSVCKAEDAEEDGRNGEAHQLDRFAIGDINCSNCYPVPRNCASQDNDQVSDGGIHRLLVHGRSATEADSCEDNGL